MGIYVYSDGVVRDTTVHGGYRYCTLSEAQEDAIAEKTRPSVASTYKQRRMALMHLSNVSDNHNHIDKLLGNSNG